MLNNSAKKLLTRTVIIVSIIYFGGFGLLNYINGYPWVSKVLQSFMGAGAIGLITVIIVVYQNQVQTISKKKEKIFEKRLYLYESTIDLFWDIIDKKRINTDEHNQFKANNQKMLLLAGSEVYIQFNKLLVLVNSKFKKNSSSEIHVDQLKSTDGENFTYLFKKFIIVCRKDLDIDNAFTNKSDEFQFEQVVDLSTQIISDNSKN